MSTKKNIVLNGIASIGSKSVRVAEQLLLVPFFLSSWGAAYYGEWLTLSIIPSILAFSDFGIGTAAANSFVMTYSGGDKKGAADIFKTGLVVVSLAVIVGLVTSAFVMAIAKHSGMLEKTLIPSQDATWALVFMLGSKLIGFYSQIFESHFRSCHKTALYTNIRTVQGLLLIIVDVCVLYLGFGIVQFALANFLSAILFNFVNAHWAISLIGDMPRGEYVSKTALDILKKGVGFLFDPLWQAVYFQGTTFVVRILLGAESVAVFNTVRIVCRSINQMFGIVNQSVMPELQIALAKNENEKACEIYRRSVQIAVGLALIGVSFLVLWGQDLYSWWTQNKLEVDKTLWNILMCGIMFNALWWSAGTVFGATNDPYKYVACGFMSSCLSVVLSLLFGYLFDINGVAVGYVMMDVFMVIFSVPIALKKIRLSIVSFFRI